MVGKRFLGFRKWMAVPVIMMMVLSGTYMFFLMEDHAEGATSLGTIDIQSGTKTFSNVDYILDGNILVNGSSSRLVFVDCTLTLSQDVGVDGELGGSDDHIYSIDVMNGGELEFRDTYITTQTDQLHPYFLMDVNIDGSGSSILFEDSVMEGPAEITATGGGRIDSIDSIFIELADKSDLDFDIDGDGSTDDDLDYNDDGPLFTFLGGSRGLIQDSQLRDTFSFSRSSRDGRIAGNITLDGSGTNVTFINSFLDIDFESNRSTGTHNMLKVTDGAVAHIVGSSFNVSASDYTYPAVFVSGSGSKALYYRWIATRVLDGPGVPVKDNTLNVYRVEGSTDRLLTAGYLTSEVTNYMGRTSLTWSNTDGSGWSLIPVITDVIRTSSMPNSNSYPEFKVNAVQGTETISAHTSFKNYPNVPDKGEAVGLLDSVLDGTADTTSAYSDLGGPFEFKQFVVTPSTSSYFTDDLDVDLTLSSSLSLKGTSAIVDGLFYPSYYAFDGHLIIRSGGHLTINDTTVNFLTDGSPAFILVEDGGILSMNNVTLSSSTPGDLHVYVMGTNIPELSLNEGSMDVGNLVARGTALIDMDAEKMNGSLNLYGSNVDATIMADKIDLDDLFARDCSLKLGGGSVDIESLDWSGVDFVSEDATFSTIIDIDNRAALTNVTFSGQLPEGRARWLQAIGPGIIERSWWVNAQAKDSVDNPVEGAVIHVQRALGPVNEDVSSHVTGEDGTIRFSLIEEEMTSSGRSYLGNYRMNASYRGIQSLPTSAVLSGTSVDAVITLPGGPNLVPELLWTEGTLIDGYPVTINGLIRNDGQFDSSPFYSSIMVDGETIQMEYIPGLAAGSSLNINTSWITVRGDVVLAVGVDVENDVKETNEDDNELPDLNTIGIGPDYVVDLFMPPTVWAYDTTDTFEIYVTNDGEEDPENNSFHINITWTDGPNSGIIRSNVTFDYIPPGETVVRTINWTPEQVGTITVIASVVSKYDRSAINSVDLRSVEVLSLPDLGLELNSFTLDTPIPVTINTTIMVSFSVENTGDLPAAPFMVSIYDGEISNETKIDIDAGVPGLSPGESIDLSFAWYASLPVGIHDLIIFLDSYDVVREQMEGNNLVTIPIMVDTPPDLTFTTNIGVSPNIVTEGKNATFWATVRNNGNTMARNARVQFSLDSDTNVIETVEMDLFPGQERNISIGWIAERTGEQSGFRTFYIVADPMDLIAEPDEENNLRSIDIKVISKPDVFMGSNDIFFSPSTDIDIGEEVTISASIRNSGETPASNLFIRFYDGDPLQGGRIISWKETQPSVSIASLPAGGLRWANVTWTPTTGGQHDIFIILDLVDSIDESNEDNNKVSWQIYVQTLPDLDLTNISLNQGEFQVNSAGVGSELIINTTIANQGDTTSPTFRIRFFNGDFDNDPEPTPIGVGMTYIAGTLPGKTSMFVEMPWTVDYPKGIRTIIVEVDLLEGEEQTSSNNRIYYQVEVFDIEDVPELIPSNSSLKLDTGYDGIDVDLEYEPKAYIGMNLTIDLNLTNIGGMAASNTTVEFVASNETDSWIEKRINIPFLETNGTDFLKGFWNLRSLGMNRLRIIVDPDNSIREFDEGNNVLTLDVEVLEAPDLSIELDLSSDDYDRDIQKFEMKKGKEYELTFTIVNNGNFTFRNLEVEFKDTASLADGESYLRTIQTLLPYQEVDITFRVEPDGSVDQTKSLIVTIDEDGMFYESDLTNNDAKANVIIKEGDQESNMLFWIILIILILLIIGGIIGFFVYKKFQTKDMAKCSNCGGLVQLDAELCSHCGVEFSEELECECGEIIPQGAVECPSCHRPVKGGLEPEEGDAEEIEEEGDEDHEDELEELEEEMEIEEMDADAPSEPTMEHPPVEEAAPEEQTEEELAECFECGALIPVSAPICPHCGAVFE